MARRQLRFRNLACLARFDPSISRSQDQPRAVRHVLGFGRAGASSCTRDVGAGLRVLMCNYSDNAYQCRIRHEITIKDLTELVRETVGYEAKCSGQLEPRRHTRKLMDTRASSISAGARRPI